MSDSGPRRIGVSIELKPHAYDPAANPELFEGVLERRVVAFLIDFLLIVVPFVVVCALSMVFMVTAWTYFLRGWLASLMANPRRRRSNGSNTPCCTWRATSTSRFARSSKCWRRAAVSSWFRFIRSKTGS